MRAPREHDRDLLLEAVHFMARRYRSRAAYRQADYDSMDDGERKKLVDIELKAAGFRRLARMLEAGRLRLTTDN